MNKKFIYSWEEKESLWHLRYDTLANQAGLPVDMLINARRQLMVIFSEVWLKEQYDKNNNREKRFQQLTKPSIVKVMCNPIINNAIEIVELSKYFVELKDQPKLNDLVRMLKNEDEFESARLNLAMAYRFRKVGMEDVLLEPDTIKGKGDISGSYLGSDYLIECSIVSESNIENRFIDDITVSIKKQLENNTQGIGIEVTFNKVVDLDAVNATIKEIKKACFEFRKTSSEDLQFSFEVADCRVFRFDSNQPKRIPDMDTWDVVLGLSTGTPIIPNNIYSVDLENTKTSGMIYFKGLKSSIEQKPIYDRIKLKLESKLSQTSGHSSTLLRVFVIMIESPIEKLDYNDIWGHIKSNLQIRPNVAGVFVVDRRITKLNGRSRRAYAQVFFANTDSSLNKLHTSLEKLERSDWIVEA